MTSTANIFFGVIGLISVTTNGAIVVGIWLIVVGVFEILSASALRPGVAAIR